MVVSTRRSWGGGGVDVAGKRYNTPLPNSICSDCEKKELTSGSLDPSSTANVAMDEISMGSVLSLAFEASSEQAVPPLPASVLTVRGWVTEAAEEEGTDEGSAVGSCCCSGFGEAGLRAAVVGVSGRVPPVDDSTFLGGINSGMLYSPLICSNSWT